MIDYYINKALRGLRISQIESPVILMGTGHKELLFPLPTTRHMVGESKKQWGYG